MAARWMTTSASRTSAAHQRLVADVALDEVEGRVGAEVEEGLLADAVGEVVNGADVVAGSSRCSHRMLPR